MLPSLVPLLQFQWDKRFKEALALDAQHPDKLGAAAYTGGKLAGMAAAGRCCRAGGLLRDGLCRRGNALFYRTAAFRHFLQFIAHRAGLMSG